MDEIKDILKLERKTRNLTQKDIAVKLNLTREAYTMYETGRSIPPTEVIIKLADMYNVSTDYLLGRYHKTTDN